MSGDRIIHGHEAERRRLYAYDGQDRSQRRTLSREEAIRLFIAIAGIVVGIGLERFL
jgi:hypothetical protein